MPAAPAVREKAVKVFSEFVILTQNRHLAICSFRLFGRICIQVRDVESPPDMLSAFTGPSCDAPSDPSDELVFISVPENASVLARPKGKLRPADGSGLRR